MDLHPLAERTGPLKNSPIIAVAGSLTIDIIFETESIPKVGESRVATSLVAAPGGKGANIAIAAYRASHNRPKSDRDFSRHVVADDEIRVFMNGAVGDDEHGPLLRTAMEEQGIDVTGVLTLKGERTGQVVIMIQPKDGQTSAIAFKGTNQLFQPRETSVECLAGDTKSKPSVIVTNCTPRLETVEQILETGHRNGVETVLSASPIVHLDSRTYTHIDHLVINEHEAAEMSSRPVTEFADVEIAKEIAASFVRHGVRYVIVTLGEAGAVYATHDGVRGHVSAEKNVKVRDTTGAGDSFLGAYVVDLVRQRRRGEWDMERAIQFASKAAARAIEQLGAQTALPWADEIV